MFSNILPDIYFFYILRLVILLLGLNIVYTYTLLCAQLTEKEGSDFLYYYLDI